MTACVDCGLQIKHVGDNVWIDNAQGDGCASTNETHRPHAFNAGMIHDKGADVPIPKQERLLVHREDGLC
jgi:hypothetical protein